jgi:biopolymer transport protein ExbB/TolQ
MHDALHIDTESIPMMELAVGTLLGVLAWFINTVKSMAVSKINELECKHNQNTSRIENHCEKLNEHRTEIELLKHTSVKREDLDRVFSSLREELKDDIDNVFVRVQERVDAIYAQGCGNTIRLSKQRHEDEKTK